MKQISFLIIIIFAFSCNNLNENGKNKFSVKGQIKNAPENSYVKMFYQTNGSYQIVDSCLIENLSFELYGKSSDLDFFGLKFSDNPYIVYLLIDSADNITFNADYNNLQLYSVKNSINSQLIQSIENKLYNTNLQLSNFLKNKQKYNEIVQKQIDFSKDFIEKNIESPACVIALSERFISGEIVLPIESNFDLYKQVENKLRKGYGLKEFYQNFVTFIKNYEIVLQRKVKPKNIIKPLKLVDFFAKTIDGKDFYFQKEVKGKAVLLSFWASWCINCSQNNLAISKIQNKYPNLKIVQISLDANPSVLLDTLKKYNFKHVLINDSLVWDSEIANLYAIDEVPTNILINSKGEIVLYTSNSAELLREISKLK